MWRHRTAVEQVRFDSDGLTLVGRPAPAGRHDAIDESLAAQAEYLADLVATLDRDTTEVEEAVAQQRELAKDVHALRSGATDDATMIGGASAAFWRSWLRVTDGVPQLATQVTQPLLVLGWCAGHQRAAGPDAALAEDARG